MRYGEIIRDVDTYVSHIRLKKGTKVSITNYKSPAYIAVTVNKNVYLVPKDAVKILKEEK